MRKSSFVKVTIYILICLCIFACSKSKEDKNGSCYGLEHQVKIPIELQTIIENIKANICKETEDSIVCIVIDFFERNDSCLMWITYDLTPPILPPTIHNNTDSTKTKASIVYTDNYYGLYNYDKNIYLLFYNKTTDNSIIKKVIGDIALDSNLDHLNELYQASETSSFCDGRIFHYFINDEKQIESIR